MIVRQPDRPDHPADRAASDRLLDAARGPGPAAARPDPGCAPPAGPTDDPLARLLAAAAAPARPGELAGEEAALAAFRAARDAASAPARVARRRRLTVAALAWVGALAATATAGVAVAAVTLDRDAPTHRPAPSTVPASPTRPAPTASAPPASPAAPRPDGTPAPARSRTPAPGGPTDGSGRAAGAQLRGLCRAYLAKPVARRAGTLAVPGYAPLVAAAGAARVEEFCLRLLPAAGPTHPHRPRPSHAGRPNPEDGRPGRDGGGPGPQGGVRPRPDGPGVA